MSEAPSPDTVSMDEAPVMAPSSSSAVGEVVAERYELLDELGEGASGKVYRARDLYVGADPEIVAIKILHREFLADRQLAGRFRREASILSRLRGPHLARMLEFVDEKQVLLVALEYVDGPSLDVFFEGRGCVPQAEVIALGIQIGEGLHQAHELGVVHRDLKPSNLLVGGGYASPNGSFTRELNVRVVDFGLAKLVAGDANETMLTVRGMVFGTPDFMAPEQVAGESLDGRADLYALGVVLYSLLAGCLPFEKSSAVAMMTAHLSETPQKLSEAAPQAVISEALDAAVMRALSKRPDERFQTARAFVDALRGAGEQGAKVATFSSLAPGPARADSNIRTTMRSSRSEVEAVGRGASVKLIVPDSPRVTQQSAKPPLGGAPPTSDSSPAASRSEPSRPVVSSPSTRRAGTVPEGGRAWTVVAFVVAFAAVGVGVWLGLR